MNIFTHNSSSFFFLEENRFIYIFIVRIQGFNYFTLKPFYTLDSQKEIFSSKNGYGSNDNRN